MENGLKLEGKGGVRGEYYLCLEDVGFLIVVALKKPSPACRLCGLSVIRWQYCVSKGQAGEHGPKTKELKRCHFFPIIDDRFKSTGRYTANKLDR